jgi:hypothetical protein
MANHTKLESTMKNSMKAEATKKSGTGHRASERRQRVAAPVDATASQGKDASPTFPRAHSWDADPFGLLGELTVQVDRAILAFVDVTERLSSGCVMPTDAEVDAVADALRQARGAGQVLRTALEDTAKFINGAS